MKKSNATEMTVSSPTELLNEIALAEHAAVIRALNVAAKMRVRECRLISGTRFFTEEFARRGSRHQAMS
jgi:hypothetical protein